MVFPEVGGEERGLAEEKRGGLLAQNPPCRYDIIPGPPPSAKEWAIQTTFHKNPTALAEQAKLDLSRSPSGVAPNGSG